MALLIRLAVVILVASVALALWGYAVSRTGRPSGRRHVRRRRFGRVAHAARP